jgi:hypothetical protein
MVNEELADMLYDMKQIRQQNKLSSVDTKNSFFQNINSLFKLLEEDSDDEKEKRSRRRIRKN